MPSLMQLAGGALVALALITVATRLRRRPRITTEVRAALVATLLAYAQHFETYHAYRVLTRSRDGLAVAMLLLNAAAKSRPALYEHKVPLLRAVIDASSRRSWWAAAHTNPGATTYTNTVAIVIETTIGPILDIERVQLSVHISAEDAAAHFADAPAANGRRWAGVPLQPRAEEIARAFLQR